MTDRFDIAIIGAGMAGASIAAELAPHASVLLIEGEAQPGYHSTGRSAAFWSETYGGPAVQPLTTASRDFLSRPPPEFSEDSFLSPRGALHIAEREGHRSLEAFGLEFEGGEVLLESVSRKALSRMIPGLRESWTEGFFEPSCSDIDVAALHQAYLKAAKRAGAVLCVNREVTGLAADQGSWSLATAAGPIWAKVIVNAAGAWADRIAQLAGVLPIGLQPFRRTIAQLRLSPEVPPEMPLVIDALGRFYFKPETGRLWISPHDETPCDPCDCSAEEQDVALAIHRLEQVVNWQVERVEHSWAGLRSFAPDRRPVYGYAPGRTDFFWFAGQGGFGIQTAPAAAKLAAAILLGTTPDPLVAHIDPAVYAPQRLMN